MGKKGKLYCLGIGPGDAELLTIKAVRILREIPCIFAPKGKEEGSLALSIIKKALNLDGKEVIEAYFPMIKTRIQGKGQRAKGKDKNSLDKKWKEAIEAMLGKLNKGIDVAFLTLGDPTIYSTFFYLYDKLIELKLNIEIIPGVSSINAASSKAKIPLGLADERIAIIPANYVNDIKETLERFDTIVLMKVNKVFHSLLETLKEMNLLEKAIYISKGCMEGEKIFKDIRKVKEKDLNYFSMVIVRKDDI